MQDTRANHLLLVNNVHVENQRTDLDTGKVHWTTGKGTAVFDASFATQFGDDGNISSIAFTGQTWTTDKPNDPMPFSGSKVIPGPATPGSSDSSSGGWFSSTAAQGISFTLTCLGITGLTFASIIKEVQEYRKKQGSGSIAPVIHAAQPAAQHASAVADSIVRADVAANPIQLNPDVERRLPADLRRAANQASNLAVNAASGPARDSAAIVSGVASSARNVMMDEVNLSAEIDLRRRNGQGMNILQKNGHEFIGQVSSSLMESVDAWQHVDEVSAASVKLAEARKKADAAIKNRGEAVRALAEKAAVVQKLQSEQDAAKREVTDIETRAASGTKEQSDDVRRNQLEAEIHAKEDAIAKANREAQKADDAKEKADKAAQDALDEQEAAQEESNKVEPDLDHLHDVPLGR